VQVTLPFVPVIQAVQSFRTKSRGRFPSNGHERS
jgi:hypothetical protein